MDSLSTIAPILGYIVGAVGIIFSVYLYFRNPQIKSEKFELLFNERLTNLDKSLVNLRDNHIHSLDVKLDQTNTNVAVLTNSITRLETIINERLPKKRS